MALAQHFDTILGSTFRAFQQGPGSCIGQELVMIEAHVVMALVARYLKSLKVGAPGPPSLVVPLRPASLSLTHIASAGLRRKCMTLVP